MTETEGDDINSVCKILAPLCCSNECKNLFVNPKNEADKPSDQLCEVALALLAEVSSRSCRVLVKNKNLYGAANSLVCQALDIHVDYSKLPDWKSPIECNLEKINISDEYSSQNGKKFSSRIFGKSWTNCSPQSVVACLGFAKLLFSYTGYDKIEENIQQGNFEFLSYFMEGFNDISMRNFITTYVPSVNPMDLQIAMYVQGLLHHSSKERKIGLPSLLHPTQVIKQIAKNERSRLISEFLRNKFKDMQKEFRFMKAFEEQRKFLQIHAGCPKLFSIKEVGELNSKRPLNDQFILNEASGLLKNRCCYLDCPNYLEDLKSTNGLFKHLAKFTNPLRYYQPGFHILCKTDIRSAGTKEIFVSRMLAKLLVERNRNLKAWKGVSETEWTTFYSKLLNDYWEKVHNNSLF